MKPIHRFLPAALAALALAGVAGATPADLEARRAELTELEARVEATQRVVGPRINAAIEVAPAFLRHHRAVQAVALSPEERKALARGGVAALPPDKAAIFQAAAPAFADLKAALKSYFAAYDTYMDSEIRLRCFGSVLQVLERREALAAELDAGRLEKLDAGIADVLQEESEYRAALADPDAKNHEISNSADDVYFAAQALDDALLKLERKAGLAPKRPWGKRLGDFFRKLKAKARVGRIHATTLPAIARMFAYLYNPLRKERDPEKVSKLLRFYSKSYRWAAGMDLEVEGGEDLPTDAPVVYAFSHRSTIEDAVSMMAVMPRAYSFMVAQRAIPAFLNDKLVNEPSIINVGGRRPDGSRVDALTPAIDSLEGGRDLGIFPEGDVPTPTGETRPLRSGIHVVTQAVQDRPVYIVPVTLVDPLKDVEDQGVPRSQQGKLEVKVVFGSPIDPLKLRSVPGAGKGMLLDVIRAFWHRNLYRPDVSLAPEPSSASTTTLGTIPDQRAEAFGRLHEN